MAIKEEETNPEHETHVLVEWQSTGPSRFLELPNRPVGIALTSNPENVPTLFVAYGSGRVAVLTGEEVTTEQIEGPMETGPLRELRSIGSSVYGVGMARQVYQRTDDGQWDPIDSGLRHLPTSTKDITGLNSIHGSSNDQLITVGFDGEMWRGSRDNWTKIASPTNVLLNVVEVVDDKLAYTSGLLGTILRGQGDSWEVVEHDETTGSIVTMAWFKDHLYLSDGETLFRLEEDDSLTAVEVAGENRVVAHLHADSGALWAFGPTFMSRTTDGETWNDAIPRQVPQE